MKILIISDAWKPQLNGVVMTLMATETELKKQGHEVCIIGPDLSRFACFPLPTYREIAVELFARKRLEEIVDDFLPDAIHIATEGPLGWSMRGLCLSRGYAFTTAYHTRFPQYLAARLRFLPAKWVECLAYAWLRWFHAPSAAVMAPTNSIKTDLETRGFKKVELWSRGVDVALFSPSNERHPAFADFPKPVLLYVGRVSVEKNIEDFLDLTIEGTKVVIGSGPDLDRLRHRYPKVLFLGSMEKVELASAYASADLFVFPSKSDTFGLVLLEACAAGLRVSAYPVSGPKDIFEGEEAKAFAALDDDLAIAVGKALTLSADAQLPRTFALKHGWNAATTQFLSHLCPIIPKKLKG